VRYELRNTQLYDATMQRLRSLEAQLGFEKTRSKGGAGGVHLERPLRSLKFLRLDVIHDRGLAFVYGAALGGWAFSACNALIRLTNDAGFCLYIPDIYRELAAVFLGLIIAMLTLRAFKRIDSELAETRRLLPEIKHMRDSNGSKRAGDERS
jgi:hypothetical protein